jgi:hypothetical protein
MADLLPLEERLAPRRWLAGLPLYKVARIGE